jgi:hypothetical protein
MLSHVAVGTKRQQVRERIIPLLAPPDHVVDLQVLERAALLTPPSVPLQHPLYLPLYSALPECRP